MYIHFTNGFDQAATAITALPSEFSFEIPEGASQMLERYGVLEGVLVDLYPELSDEELVEHLAPDPEPEPTEQVPERAVVLSKLHFMTLFSDAELEAIYTAAKENVAMEVWLDKLKLAEEINLEDPRTIAGLDMLEMVGLIGEGRKAQILAAEVPGAE